MTETMKDYEKELETSLKQIEEGDLLTGTVVNVTDKEVMLDLKAYAEGVIRLEDYSREPDFVPMQKNSCMWEMKYLPL